MKLSRRLSLISSILKGRVLSGEHLAPRALPPMVKMRAIPVDKKVKTTIIHTT